MKIDIPKKLSVSGDFLSSLIDIFPYPAHVKDILPGKYIFSNQKNAEIYGMNSEDVIGMTVNDLNTLMQKNWDCKYPKTVEQLDYSVKENKEPVIDKERVILTKNGIIRLQNMTKVPVISLNHKVTAVFTFSEDLTGKADLFYVFSLYRKYYSRNRACLQFLNYLKLTDTFIKMPSVAEIYVLLAMREDNAQKGIAERINIKPKTVEDHVRHLREKLVSAITLESLLVTLRNRNMM